MTKIQMDKIIANWDKMPQWVREWTMDLIKESK
jgi:hypothetical protein